MLSSAKICWNVSVLVWSACLHPDKTASNPTRAHATRLRTFPNASIAENHPTTPPGSLCTKVTSCDYKNVLVKGFPVLAGNLPGPTGITFGLLRNPAEQGKLDGVVQELAQENGFATALNRRFALSEVVREGLLPGPHGDAVLAQAYGGKN